MIKIEEAIKNIKADSKEKFDAAIEIHINLDLDLSKQGQTVRYTITLPNGTGKSKKVAVLASKKIADADLELTEDSIDDIIKGKIKPKTDFDVIVTEPKYMPKIAKAAKVLGPVGAMPNPKNGTVTEDVEKAVEEIKKGQIEVKTEKDFPLIHTIFGKKSFDDTKLVENFNSLVRSLKQNRPQKAKPNWIKSIFVKTSMGKAVEVEIAEL